MTSKLAPGTVIVVHIDGEPFDTIIDRYGTQRFPVNTVLEYMFNHDKNGHRVPDWNVTDRMLDLNALVFAYARGDFDKKDYMKFIMSGYSVCGFRDLSEFADCVIDNPLWNREA